MTNKPQDTNYIKVNIMKTIVNDCARCGDTHEVEFREFTQNPIELYDDVFMLWGICPVLNEPILMRILEIEENLVVLS